MISSGELATYFGIIPESIVRLS